MHLLCAMMAVNSLKPLGLCHLLLRGHGGSGKLMVNITSPHWPRSHPLPLELFTSGFLAASDIPANGTI